MNKKDRLSEMTPDIAIDELVAGNKRFVTNKNSKRDYLKAVPSLD